VSFDEGKQKADSLGIKFFETSAKENFNVSEMFFELTRDIKEVLSKKKSETQAAGTQLHLRENNSLCQISCFKCS